MKLKKFLKSKAALATILMGGFLLVQSCGKDSDSELEVVISKTALETIITNATTIANSAVEGTAEGLYVYGSVAELQDAITLAQGVLDNSASTQIAIDNTVIALNAAIDVFESNAIIPIDPTNLVGHWTFDEGSGTTVSDSSGNNFNGTFGNEALFGTGTTTWTTDRYGNVGKALLFNEGAKVTIPYNTSLNPDVMSISVWINASEINGNNRFIGLHSWNGYKFQLQDGNKAFFTAATADGIYDRDTDPALEVNTWYHLTVTIGEGNMTFYINGTATKVWDDTPGTIKVVTGHDLVFGVGSSKYAATTDDYDTDKIIPAAWGGFFRGSMDEVRIYKTVLSASQVQSIYDTEKVPN